MSKEPTIAVVLTPEAREILGNEPLSIFIEKGSYFLCDSAKFNGYFVDMIIHNPPFNADNTEHKHIAHDLSIPAHYVLYMITTKANKSLGF